MKHFLRKAVVLVLFLVATSQITLADTTISTYPSWNGSSGVSGWGSSTPYFGQTFTVPTDGNDTLTSFDFSVFTLDSLVYQADIYQWTGNSVTGPALFASGSTPLNASFSYQTIETDTGDLKLTAGQQYVAFYTFVSSTGGASNFGSPFSSFVSVYSGGDFVSTTGTLTDPWSNSNGFSSDGDLAFSATFTETPEPSTWVLMITGCAGLLLFVRIRSRLS